MKQRKGSSHPGWMPDKGAKDSLREYRNQLVSRMDKYRANLRQIPAEWEREAIQRFRLGLKNKFMKANILIHCSGDAVTLE
jgi:hypothetical protein